MKKFYRNIICLLMTATLVMTMSTTALAADETTGLTGPSDLFIEIIDNLFVDSSRYQVFDKNGNDITNNFLTNYQDAYNAENYNIIWEAVSNNIKVIAWKDDNPEAQLLMDGSASEHFYEIGKTTEHMAGSTFEMLYSVSGTYKYHDSNGQISECSDAILNIDVFNAGALFSYDLFNISTRARVATDKKSVTFSATFSLAFNYNSYYVPGLVVWTENFGPYTGSVTGHTY